MSNHWSKRDDFGFSCPSGGSWYACGSGSHFVGCCASNPCSNGCSQGNIRPGAFNAAEYGQFSDASCGSGSDFFTCASGNTFWGCCKSNPCNQGSQCPSGDLTPAVIDLNRPEQVSAYSPTGGSSSTSASSTAQSTSQASAIPNPTSTAASTTSASATATAAAVSNEQHQSDGHIAAIAGGAAGGGVVIALLICWLIYYVCHAKKSRDKHRDTLERRQSDLTMRIAEKPDKGGSPSDAPPVYTSPIPNDYRHDPYDPHSYVYQHNAPAQYELSASPSSPRSMWKPNHRLRLSELSGETTQRTELESPMPSPRISSTPQSPRTTVGDEPNWTAHGWQREPDYGQALGIHNANRDEIQRSEGHPDFRQYRGV